MSETNSVRLARIRAEGEAFGWAQAGVFGPPEKDALQWLLKLAECGLAERKGGNTNGR